MQAFDSHIRIADDVIGQGQRVYIVAEMSANHGQDFERAVDIVHAAKEAGADAVKLQTYRPDTLTLNARNSNFYIKQGPWKGQYLYDLYTSAMTPWEWHADLKSLADKIGMTLFSAPFDCSAVDLLEELNFPAYKIASPELIDHELIRYTAQTTKPIIISTGSGTKKEIDDAVGIVSQERNSQLCLLKCTSEYPAPFSSMNLRTIEYMRDNWHCPIGLSDHSMGDSVAVASVALGACLIEKHFMLDKSTKTADSFFSLDKDEFSRLVKSVREVEAALGNVHFPESINTARRALYAVEDIEAGQTISVHNVKNLRPGNGEHPLQLSAVLGKRSLRTIKRGEAISDQVVE